MTDEPGGRAFPHGDLTAAAALKLAQEAQQLVDHLDELERRRKTDRRIYIALLTLAVLLAGTAAGTGIGLIAIFRVNTVEKIQVTEHRDRNEVSHDALCRQMNRIAAQAHLAPVPCPSPLRFK